MITRIRFDGFVVIYLKGKWLHCFLYWIDNTSTLKRTSWKKITNDCRIVDCKIITLTIMVHKGKSCCQRQNYNVAIKVFVEDGDVRSG